MRRLLLAPFAVVLLLASCGDDDADDSSDGDVSAELKPYADALATSYAADDIADDFTFTEENADCIATRSVRVVGIDRLEAVGTPDEVITATAEDLAVFDLDQAELDKIASAFLECVDDAEELLGDAFLSGDPSLTEEQSACVADLVDRDLLIRILSAGLGGQAPEEALSDLQDDYRACL